MPDMTYEYGFYAWSDEEYHAGPGDLPPTLRASTAHKLLSTSPRTVQLTTPELGGTAPKQDSKAQRLGKALHCLLLGDEERITVATEWSDWRTNVAKAWRTTEEHNGGVPLLYHEHMMLTEWAANGQKALDAKRQQEGWQGRATFEQALLWRDADTLCRSRLDWCLVQPRPIIIDIKTAYSAHPRAFGAAIYNYGLDIQAYAYRQALGHALDMNPGDIARIQFYWLVVDKNPPYEAYLTQPGTPTWHLGEHRWQLARDLWHHCLEHNTWPGHSPDTVDVPEWAHRQFGDTDFTGLFPGADLDT